MTLDLILRNGRMADGQSADIGIRDGLIAAIGPDIGSAIPGEGDELDLAGGLVSAGLVETHIHLDKSRILDRCTAPPAGVRDYMERVSAV